MKAKGVLGKPLKKQVKKIHPNAAIHKFFGTNSNKTGESDSSRIIQAQIPESTFVHEPKNLASEIKPQSKLHIMHWNVNSLNARINNEHFLKYIGSADFDIICFNETKLTYKKMKELKLDEHKIWSEKYNQYWAFSTKKLGYSGVCIFSKLKPISVSFGINKHKFDSEGRVITLEFDDFYLVSTYTPNSGSNLDRLEERTAEWEKLFKEHIKSLSKKGVIIMGDLNVAKEEIDVANPKTACKHAGFTDKERACFVDLLGSGLRDVWREKNPEKVAYTYWDQRSRARERNVGWRIDYCLADEKTFGRVIDVKIREEVLGSDHCPVEVVFQI